MKNMRFLKDKRLLLAVLLLPVFFAAIDGPVRVWQRDALPEMSFHPFLQAFDPFINTVAHGSTLIITAIVILAAGWFLKKARLYETGRSLFIGLIAAGISVQVIKHLIGRARPRITDTLLLIGPTLKKGYDSFPSGHTTMAFCFAAILSGHLPKYRVLFYLFAVIVGLERIEDGAHFPSDALAGAILGFIVGKLSLEIKLFTAQSQVQRQTQSQEES